MTDESSEDPACEAPANHRESEHRRRNRLQAELLQKAYDRHRHAAFIDAALRRSREKKDTDKSERTGGS